MGIPDLVRISFKTSGGGVGSRCAPERHATLGCAGATQPGAWQRPGTWGLNEKLNMCSSVLGRGAGGGAEAPFPASRFSCLRGTEAQECSLGEGGWPRSSQAALLLGRGQRREDTALHLALKLLVGYVDLGTSNGQGKAKAKGHRSQDPRVFSYSLLLALNKDKLN